MWHVDALIRWFLMIFSFFEGNLCAVLTVPFFCYVEKSPCICSFDLAACYHFAIRDVIPKVTVAEWDKATTQAYNWWSWNDSAKIGFAKNFFLIGPPITLGWPKLRSQLRGPKEISSSQHVKRLVDLSSFGILKPKENRKFSLAWSLLVNSVKVLLFVERALNQCALSSATSITRL